MATPLRHTAILRSSAGQRGSRGPDSQYSEFPVTDAGARRAAACMWTGTAGWARAIRLFPDGCIDLVWTGEALLVHGPSDTVSRGTLRAGQVNTGIRIHAGAGGALLGVPLLRLRDRTVLIEDVLASQGYLVERQLKAARSDQERRAVLENFVAGRAHLPSLRNSVCQSAARYLSCGTLQGLASELRLGDREIRRLFAEEVGLSPKALQRVLRFRKVLAMLPTLAQRQGAAAVVAAEAGYADQAHMSRECRRIVGETPGSLARRFADRQFV
jgi:AraC-like DNA-binding protein